MRRPANTLEVFVTARAKQKPEQFGYCLTLGAQIREPALRAALEEAKRQYPLMAVRMVQDQARRYFVDTDGVAPFPVTAYAASERPWTAILEAELLPPFRMDVGPPVRFALRPVAGGTELYAVFHHGFADGHAAVRCFDLLLSLLGGSGRATPADRDHDLYSSLRRDVVEELSRRPTPPLPPLERLAPQELERRLAAPYRAPASFVIRTWALSREETSRLVEASRAAGVTVHAALGAAWLTAAAEILGGADRRRRTIQCPVDLRPYLVDEARDGYGVYVGIAMADIDCSAGRPLTAVARDIKGALDLQRRGLKLVEEEYRYRDVFRDTPDPDAAVAAVPEHPPTYDFSLSNLGRLALGTSYGAVTLEAIWGPTFSAINGERVIGVNTHAGVLRMTDIWDPALCDSAAYDRIRARAREQLAAFLVR